MQIEQCIICDGDQVREVIEDHRASDHIRLAAKHWHCDECQSDFVTGSQMDYNAKCTVIEIEGPLIEIGSIHNANAYFDWSWRGRGFGQLSFQYKDGKLTCNNECMSRESVRELLRAFADHIADTAILEGERD